METEFTVKNSIQHGKTIEIANTDSVEIPNGSLAMVGRVAAITITDIAAGRTGDGLTGGVFLLPRPTTDAITISEQVHIRDGKVQNDATGADLAGVAWEDAAASSAIVAMRTNA